MSHNYRNKDRGYSQHSRSYYAKSSPLEPDEIDEVLLGFYPSGGGTSGEFKIVWKSLGNCVSPKLVAWDDSWGALVAMPDVLRLLKAWDGKDVSPQEVCESLDVLGFKDLTKTTYPNDDKKSELRQQALDKLSGEERAALGL